MPLLDSVLQLTITSTGAQPSRQGFGIPLFMVALMPTVASLVLYADLPGMLQDGYTVNSPAYQMATAAFSQNPRPLNVMIGRRALPFTQVVSIYPLITTPGYTYSFTFTDSAGVVSPLSYTNGGSETIGTVTTALTALISPLADSTAVATGSTHVLITESTAGKIFKLSNLPGRNALLVVDSTPDPGIATDMAAIYALDQGASWYSVTLDHAGAAEIAALAVWVETVRRLAVNDCPDSAIVLGTAGHIGLVLQAAAYARSDVYYRGTGTQTYFAAGLLGKMLPKDPGAATWAYKTVVGQAPDILTAAEHANAVAANVNTYESIAGQGKTLWGENADGGWTDILIGVDWLYNNLQVDIAVLLGDQDKVPFTDGGIDMVRGVVMNRLLVASKAPFNILDPTPGIPVPIGCTFPKVRNILVQDKAARRLPSGTAQGTYQGAIHRVVLAIILTP